MDLDIGQLVWHQDWYTKQRKSKTIHEDLEEPHSFTVQDSARQYYGWNRNWIKPRQIEDKDISDALEPMGPEAESTPVHSHTSPEVSASGPPQYTLQWMPCPMLKPPSCRNFLPGEHLYLACRHLDQGSLQESTKASHQGN